MGSEVIDISENHCLARTILLFLLRNFWHLSAKILYTVEPKTATSPYVHFEVAASPTEKISLLDVSVLSYFEIVEIIGPNTREIT